MSDHTTAVRHLVTRPTDPSIQPPPLAITLTTVRWVHVVATRSPRTCCMQSMSPQCVAPCPPMATARYPNVAQHGGPCEPDADVLSPRRTACPKWPPHHVVPSWLSRRGRRSTLLQPPDCHKVRPPHPIQLPDCYNIRIYVLLQHAVPMQPYCDGMRGRCACGVVIV